MANIGTLTVIIDGETFKLEKELKKAKKQVKDFTKKGTSGFKAMRQTILSARSAVIALGAVAALVASKLIGGSVKAFGDFETALGKVNSLVNDSKLVFGDWREGIEDLSIEFGQSKIELTKGLFDIISATIPASEAMKILRQSAILAVGGFATTDVTTKALILTIQKYGSELNSVSDASDFLFTVQQRGILTLQDVAKNIGSVIANAKGAGISLNDLGIIISVVSRAGIGAEQTMVRVNRVISSLTKPTLEAKQVAKDLGFSLEEGAISGGKLTDIMQKLGKATNAQLRILLNERRAFQAGNQIKSEAAKIAEDLAAQLDKQGIAQDRASTAQDLLNNSTDRFKQLMDSLKISFGESFAPAMKEFSDTMLELKENGGIDVLKAIFTAIADIPLTPLKVFSDIISDINFLIEKGKQLIASIPPSAREEEFISKEDIIFEVNEKTDLGNLEKKTNASTGVDPGVLLRNRNLLNNFLNEKDRLTETSTTVAVNSFERQIFKFQNLVDIGKIDAKELEDFKNMSIKRIELNNNTAFQTMMSTTQDWADTFTDSLVDIAFGAEVTFGNILESFSRMILKMLIQIKVVQPLMQSLFGASVQGGKGTGIIGNFISSFSSRGSSSPARGLPPIPNTLPAGIGLDGIGVMAAKGGVATKPTAGIFGEAGAEALIPLDRFKDFMGGGSNVQVNIIGAPEGTKTEEIETEGGGKTLNVIIDEATADNVRSGTKTFQKIASSFSGITPTLKRR